MSHRATVAYANEDGTFDLHYSHNGADGFVLRDVLERYLEGQVSKDANGMPGLMPVRAEEMLRDTDGLGNVEFDAIERDLIESEPREESVPREHLAAAVNFANCEALYVVENWEVKTYAPIHITTMVVPYFSQGIDVEIYEIPKDGTIEDVLKDSREPDAALSGGDYKPGGKLDDLPEEMYEMFEQFHLDLLDTYNRVYHQNKQQEESAILYDRYIMKYSITNPQSAVENAGVFVKVWGGGENEPSYPWGEITGLPAEVYPRNWANAVRFEISRDMLEQAYRRMYNLDIGQFSSAGQQVLEEEAGSSLEKFSSSLVSAYGDDIEWEFMPESMRERIQTEAADSE